MKCSHKTGVNVKLRLCSHQSSVVQMKMDLGAVCVSMVGLGQCEFYLYSISRTGRDGDG